MNFNFIDNMSKKIQKQNAEYGLDELFDRQDLKEISKEFCESYKYKLCKRCTTIIKKIVFDDKFRFLKQYLKNSQNIVGDFLLYTELLFQVEKNNILENLQILTLQSNQILDFNLCLNIFLFNLKSKKLPLLKEKIVN